MAKNAGIARPSHDTIQVAATLLGERQLAPLGEARRMFVVAVASGPMCSARAGDGGVCHGRGSTWRTRRVYRARADSSA